MEAFEHFDDAFLVGLLDTDVVVADREQSLIVIALDSDVYDGVLPARDALNRPPVDDR